MSAAELLRRAAKVLRSHVADLPVRVQADWNQDGAEIYAGPEREWVGETMADGGDEVSSYVALMQPKVALALANWLELEAKREDHSLAEFGYRTVPALVAAVARAILREES